MLNENIKAIRKAKGLSQQELAVKVNVVRQTVSKWEQGLSVPDADMLLALSEALETPVSVLLGETVVEPEADTLQAISQKLEVINLQLARRKTTRRKVVRWVLISFCALLALLFAALLLVGSPYLRGIQRPRNRRPCAFHSLECVLSGWRRLSFWLRWLGFSSPIRKSERGFSYEEKDIRGHSRAGGSVGGVVYYLCARGSGTYLTAADEIALRIQLDTKEDVDCWCTTTARKTATTAGASPTRTARCFRAIRKTWWCGTGRSWKAPLTRWRCGYGSAS